MDTIVYLEYVSHDVQDRHETCDYILKEHLIQDYRLIKVQVWETLGQRMVRRARWDVFSINKRLQKRRKERLKHQNRSYMSGQLRLELAEYLEERDEVFLCYDESVKADSWVRDILPFSEFADYLQWDWVVRLLPKACNHHFLVLGDVPCIKEVLWELAPRMKSVSWVAPDLVAEDLLEDFAEDFYQETGLAIRLEFLPTDITYGQLVIPDDFVKEAVTVLDFAEGKHIPHYCPPKGSLWLNMTADRDKERRIRVRGLKCEVISLRKQWKNAPIA